MEKLTSRLLAGLSMAAIAAGLGPEATALTVRDDVTVQGSEERADDPAYDGVIQLYLVDKASGGIFFNCTGSLINPRTVLSAAHCFNDFPSNFYGSGTQPLTLIAAYGPDTFDGLFGGPIIVNQSFELDARNGYSWAEQVLIHPDADPAFGPQLPFPGADVAMVALTDPLSNLPTYSMLFSQLPVGTHVQMVGYGGHGIGSTGNTGIDGKRQAGENILGLVGSQNDFLRGAFLSPTAGVFGNPDGDQLLYYTDFDRPDRDTSECRRETLLIGPNDLVCDPGPFSPLISADGTSVTSVNDSIDWFPGDALPNESGTAGGDSGSALFADELVAGELLITGVLSGGFTFTSPAPSGYGDVSYYNPLFLFHDFISEANPYKYVGTVAGDGNWSDGEHWVQLLDPGYRVIDESGNVVNGLPEGPEPGVTGTDPREGIVFDTDINDVTPATGGGTPTGKSTAQVGDLEPTNRAADGQVAGLQVGAGSLAADMAASGTRVTGLASQAPAPGPSGDTANDILAIAPVSLEADGDTGLRAQPQAGSEPELTTFLYGDIGSPGPWAGPGSTGAVPNNGVNENGFFNYFDVTLGAAGTTTVDMDVVIDRLTIDNAGATLDVAAEQTFISLIDAQIASGTLDVSGTFAARDILNGGLVTGTESGLIVTDTLWNLGLIDAGTGLGVAGDVVFTSSGALRYSGAALDIDGNVSLDGAVLFVNDDPGQSGTLLTFTGDALGVFNTQGYTGVRRVNLSYLENQVDFDITALSFVDFVGADALDANGLAFATYFDQQRASSFTQLQAIYDQIDFLDARTLVDVLPAFTPSDAFQTPGLSTLATGTATAHLSRRFDRIRSGLADGTAFNSGASTLQLASLGTPELMGLIDQAEAETAGAGARPSGPVGKRGFGVFGEVSVSTGEQEAGLARGEADVDGTTITIGADGAFENGLRLGVFGSYSDGESDFQSGLSAAEGDGYLLGAYGMKAFQLVELSGYAGFGQRDLDTARNGALGNMLTGSTEADEIVAGAAVRRPVTVDRSTGYMLVPEARLDHQTYDISGYTETGGAEALVVDDRDYSSTQLKLGADMHFYDVADPAGSRVRPVIGLRFVRDLDADDDSVSAAFVDAPGAPIQLVGAERDDNWFEPRAALTFGSAERVSGSVFVEGVVDRDDLSYMTLGFNVKSRF